MRISVQQRDYGMVHMVIGRLGGKRFAVNIPARRLTLRRKRFAVIKLTLAMRKPSRRVVRQV